MKKKLLSALLVASVPTIASAQSTIQSVSSIFQANCTTGCHSGGSPSANLNLSGNSSELYDALVGVTPTNPAAAAKGYKLIDAGYPHKSFLLYKCATTAWDDQYAMDISEGTSMPQNQPSLDKDEIELIRQWVLYGAPETGTVVDPQTLDDYYNDNGMARIARPEAPAPGEGFQLHMGPFFLEPGAEVEFYKKEKIGNQNLENVTRFDAIFNDESHHYLLFEFIPGTDGSIDEGLRPVTVQNAFQDAEYMVGWVDSDVTELPAGTAYKLEANSVLDLNYHLINYASNGDSILAAEAYVNYYTDNTTPNLIEMESQLLINLSIYIPNNGDEVSFTDEIYSSGSTDTLYVWFLSSHTHKYGTDYDIYKRNPNGSQGEQLYEGFYNTTYDFNQGYYDWEHPGNLYLDEVYGELIPIAEKDGLIQVAKFEIPGSANEPQPLVTFGLTTNDEMMLAFIQYTRQRVPEQNPEGIFDREVDEPSFISVYPNPTSGNSSIRFSLEESADVNLSVYNSLGQEVRSIYSGSMAAGQANFEFDAANGNDLNGLYLIQLVVNDKVYTQRLLHLKH